MYVPLGSPLFSSQSMLVSEYSSGNVVSYTIDANGNPVLGSRRVFVAGLTGAEGAAIDPLTGDFLFSTFGGGNQIIEVRGFMAPAPVDTSIPTLSTWSILVMLLALMSSGLVFVRKAQGRSR